MDKNKAVENFLASITKIRFEKANRAFHAGDDMEPVFSGPITYKKPEKSGIPKRKIQQAKDEFLNKLRG